MNLNFFEVKVQGIFEYRYEIKKENMQTFIRSNISNMFPEGPLAILLHGTLDIIKAQ